MKPDASRPPDPSTRPHWNVSSIRPERLRELSLVLMIVLAVVIFALLVENLLSGTFFVRVTSGLAIIAILAAAQTVVVVTRNIDLSVGSIVGVSAYMTGHFLGDHATAHPLAAVALAVGIGCILGLVNGTLVAYGRVPAIIVTLGTLALYRTMLIEYANAKNITVDTLPQWLPDFSRAVLVRIGGIDVRLMFAIAIAVIFVLQFVLGRLRWGRWLYAVGSNPDAALQVGIPVQRVVLSAFVVCGGLAGLAGFTFLVRFGTITVFAGGGLELASVAAAVVGGVSTLGGSGTLVGALLGATLIGLLNQSLLRVPEVSEFWRDAILGVLILAAVVGDMLLRRRLNGRGVSGSSRGSSADGAPGIESIRNA